jgi:hypothetical protein
MKQNRQPPQSLRGEPFQRTQRAAGSAHGHHPVAAMKTTWGRNGLKNGKAPTFVSGGIKRDSTLQATTATNDDCCPQWLDPEAAPGSSLTEDTLSPFLIMSYSKTASPCCQRSGEAGSAVASDLAVLFRKNPKPLNQQTWLAGRERWVVTKSFSRQNTEEFVSRFW